MTVDVYDANSAAARAIFARKRKEDIMLTQIECWAYVDVYDDHETDRWAHYERVNFRKPDDPGLIYLEIQGTVSELFFDEDDERVFPCGAKTLMIKDFDKDKSETEALNAIPVKVLWWLTAEEHAYIVSQGFGYSDFKPPEILRGNRLAIPVNIVYKACYESPICAVSIVKPFELGTSTLRNGYVTFFQDSVVSQEMLRREKENNGILVNLNYQADVPIMNYEAEDVADVIELPDEPVASEETHEPVMTQSDKEVAAISEEISVKVKEAADEYDAAHYHETSVDVNRVLEEMDREASREESGDEFGGSRNTDKRGALRLSEKIAMLREKAAKFSDNNDGDSNKAVENAGVITDMTNYKNDENASDADKQHSKAEAYADEQRERMQNIDRVRDNQALNAGNSDIAGFGAASKGDKEAEEERKKVRRVDTALDNQALNSGSTDISGFGSNRGSLAQGLLSRVTQNKGQRGGDLMPEQPSSDNSQRFL